jgi:hypothetical protein
VSEEVSEEVAEEVSGEVEDVGLLVGDAVLLLDPDADSNPAPVRTDCASLLWMKVTQSAASWGWSESFSAVIR